MKKLATITGLMIALAAWGLVMPVAAPADEIETWPFDIFTEGEDVYYVSPTAIDNTADWYTLSYEITMVEVTVRYLFLVLDVDVTDQIPPEDLTGSETRDGPPPITVYNGNIAYPDLPPYAVSAHLMIQLNAGGYGSVSATDIVLGEMDLYIDPFGTVTVQIEGVRVVGTVTAEAFWYPLGDLNCDRAINGFDIDAFVLALGDSEPYDVYYAAYPDCDHTLADINQDGAVDGFDIDPFVDLIGGG